MNCTYIAIIEQEHGEPFEDIIKNSEHLKAQGYRAEQIHQLADGRKQVILTGTQRILPKSEIIIQAYKIIEKLQREGDIT